MDWGQQRLPDTKPRLKDNTKGNSFPILYVKGTYAGPITHSESSLIPPGSPRASWWTIDGYSTNFRHLSPWFNQAEASPVAWSSSGGTEPSPATVLKGLAKSYPDRATEKQALYNTFTFQFNCPPYQLETASSELSAQQRCQRDSSGWKQLIRMKIYIDNIDKWEWVFIFKRNFILIKGPSNSFRY